MTQLSEHFSYEEAIASQEADRKGIHNAATAEVMQTAYRSAVGMEKVRTVLGNTSVHINSWIRCLELNRALGSHDTSQHLKGEAIDFIAPAFGTPLQICKEIIKNQDLIRFDQLILEHTWVHISFAILSGKPRGSVISLLATGGYSSGLTDKLGNPL